MAAGAVAGAAGAAFAASATLSPSAARIMIGAFTFTPSVPSGTTICATVPLVDGLDFHRGLVGFDLANDLAGFHGVADLDVPLRELALGHRRREGRHQNRSRHDQPSTRTSAHRLGGIGSGLCWAYSAASLMVLRTSASTALSAASSVSFSSIRILRTWSIGSRSLRYLSTSSLVRYFAGSLIEWPR